MRGMDGQQYDCTFFIVPCVDRCRLVRHAMSPSSYRLSTEDV